MPSGCPYGMISSTKALALGDTFIWSYPITHRIHVWYIYLQNWVILRVNVGKYSSTMEHMGIMMDIFKN